MTDSKIKKITKHTDDIMHGNLEINIKNTDDINRYLSFNLVIIY